MAENLHYRVSGIRSRYTISLLLVAVLTAGFVFFFSKQNRDISALNMLNLKIINLSNTIDKIIVSAERVRMPRTLEEEVAALDRIEAVQPEFQENLNQVREAYFELQNSIKLDFKNTTHLENDPFWVYQDFSHRVNELVYIRNNLIPNGQFEYFDFQNARQTIDNAFPYGHTIDRILAIHVNITEKISPQQSYFIAERLGKASGGIRSSTMLFMALSGVLCILLFLLIYLPMEKLIGKQFEKLQVANAEAKRADKAKSEFLANISHEIRTPMNGVMGMTELLIKTKLDERQKKFADVILRSGNSLMVVINDILDFSKIDAGAMQLNPSPFVLSQMIDDVASLIASKVAEKDIEFSIRIDPLMPNMFVGDVGRLRQVLINLLSNAVKFTENGFIILDVSGDVRERQAHLQFSVRDSGIGIRPEDCEHILEKFTQVDESATRKYDGAGLGLAISSSLVRLMGGEIKVKSTPGLGATFSFEIILPVHEDNKRSEPKDAIDIVGSRVIVIEENAINSRILKENMQAWQLDVAVIENPLEALDVMRVMRENLLKIDCVVIDFQITRMKAEAIIHAMRKNTLLADIPIILLTSQKLLEGGKNFSSLGIQAHLIKPLQTRMLHNTLVSVISDSQSANDEAKKGIAMVRALIGNDADSKFIEKDTPTSPVDVNHTNVATSNDTLFPKRTELNKNLEADRAMEKMEIFEAYVDNENIRKRGKLRRRADVTRRKEAYENLLQMKKLVG